MSLVLEYLYKALQERFKDSNYKIFTDGLHDSLIMQISTDIMRQAYVQQVGTTITISRFDIKSDVMSLKSYNLSDPDCFPKLLDNIEHMLIM